MSQLSVGASAPDFELRDFRGRPYQLRTALKKGPVALVFYKASCPTSQFTLPHVQRIFGGAGKNWGLQIWAISQDDTKDTQGFASHFGIEFDILIDEHPYEVSATYGIGYVPSLFVIEQDGTISLSDFGFTKASLNRIAGFELFPADDGLPATRSG
jgi:peroxiredoxin